MSLAGLLMTTALGAGTAFAQTAAPPASAQDTQATTVSEIVVTAQKRSENIENVPATISVVGAQQLTQFHVTQLADIGAYIPGLQVDSGGTPGQTQLSIRGIAPVGANATVATYIDDTPIGSSSFHDRGAGYGLDLLPYDVQRIEVLEGPQGTLYGANALGGIVRFVLTQPSLTRTDIHLGGDLEGISGSDSAGGGARAMINTPIVQDKLGFIGSYAFEDTPGFIDNFRSGEKDQNKVHQESGRLALLWQANPDINLKLGFLYQHTDGRGNSTVALDPATLRPLGPELSDNNYLPNLFETTLHYYTADLNWNLHWANFVSATSYSEQNLYTQQDGTITYGPILGLFGYPDALTPFQLSLGTKKFTQEFRLASPTNVKLEWLVGAYYDHETSTNVQYVRSYNPDLSSIAGFDPLFIGELPTTYEEIAGFGDLTYHFTDWFDVSGGVRYAHNKQTFAEIVANGSPILSAANVPGGSSEGVWTYSVSPRLHFTKDIMAYARVASGYQPGGPNTALPGVPPSVNSSTLTNYEVGLKSTFWQHRAVLNVSAFDLEWNNIQVAGTSPGGVNYTANGGTARSRGVEGDASIQPVAGLTLAATATYTDAIFTEDVPSIFARSGNKLPFIPMWAGSLRADYVWPLGDDLRAHVGGGLRLVDDRFSPGPDTPDEYKTPAYAALDLNADLTKGRYTVRLFVKNLTDTRTYLTDYAYQNGITGSVVQVEGVVLQPRTVGVAFDVKL